MVKTKYLKFFFTSLVALIIIFISINTYQFGAKGIYRNLFFLPLIHGILMLTFFLKTNKMLIYPSQYIIYITLFVRNVITPLLILNSTIRKSITFLDTNTINLAIFIMLYETFVIFLLLANKEKIIYKNTRYSFGKIICWGNVGKTIIVLSVICLMFWVFLPSIKNSYESVFNAKQLIAIAYNVDKESMMMSSRTLYTLGKMLILICRYLLTIILLFWVRKKTNKSSYGIFIALIILFLQIQFIASELIFVLYISIFVYFITIRLWPESKRSLIFILGTLSCFGILVLAYIKSGATSWGLFRNELGTILQAYFPGVINLSAVLVLPRINIIDRLFSDLYSLIPFRNSLFGLQVVNLANYFNMNNNMTGQILPLIGESYYYFGIILSPLLSSVFVIISINANEKMNNCKDVLHYGIYLLIMIYFSFGCVCFNFIICGQTFMNTIFPMMIICFFKDKKYLFDNLQ